MHEVVRHREREVAADRARASSRPGSSSPSSTGRRDRPLALEHERERRRRGDELDQLAEERLLGVLGVVLLRRASRSTLTSFAPRIVSPRASKRAQDLAGEAALDRVRLDQDECPLDRHRAAESTGRRSGSRRCPRRSRRLGAAAASGATSRSSGGSAIVSSNTGERRTIGVSQYGHTCQSGSSGVLQRHARLLQLRRADRADEELGLDRGAADRAVRVVAAEPLLHRPDLELALADVLQVLGRPEEEVDERPEERRDERRAASPSRPATDRRSAGARPCRPSRRSPARRRRRRRSPGSGSRATCRS